MIHKGKIVKTILAVLLTVNISLSVSAQDTTNILPLHTGKSYILDFPVKITRVVGGDPSAMELNLFKKGKDENLEGYQLLIAPISEKNTNIIIWTDDGLYVFDVIIDNSSPYTAETVINIPLGTKKFNIPVVESSESKIIAGNNPAEPQNNFENNYETVENISTNSYVEENTGPETMENFVIDTPPEPESQPVKPELKQVKTEPAKTITENKTHIPIKITKETPVKVSKPIKPEPESIEIPLKPQVSNNYSVESSLDKRPQNLYSGKLTFENEGLKLEVNSVNRVDSSLVIHLSLINTTPECKYLLWDLTKVSDAEGKKLHVRNQNLPPGIISPGRKVKGDIIVYPRSNKQDLPNSGAIYMALLDTQGEQLIRAEIPLSQER